jgi:membrane protease YdiL (CAAX protease family)
VSGRTGIRRSWLTPGQLVTAAGVGGTALLGVSFSAGTGSPQFYLLTAALASTWTAGAAAYGPIPAGRAGRERGLRPYVEPVLTGVGTFGLFYAIARLARHNPPLNRAISSVFRYVHEGSTGLVLLTAGVNAVAEELYFRGAVWDMLGDSRPLALTSAVYTASTAASRNLSLVLGGAATSLIFGAQRARSGGVVAPAVAHLTWSVLMVTCLAPLFRSPPGEPPGYRQADDEPG